MEPVQDWFDPIYLKYRKTLLKIAWHIMSDPDLAEDMVQYVFMTMLLKYNELKDRENIKPWLVKTLKNKIMTELQKAHYYREVPLSPDFDAPVDFQDQLKFYDILPDGLSDEDKKILYLHIEAGLSHIEIANMYGCTPEASRMRLYRAKKNCEKLMQKDFSENSVTFRVPEQIIGIGGANDV